MLVPMLRKAMGLEARSLGQALRRMRAVVSIAALTAAATPATAEDCDAPNTPPPPREDHRLADRYSNVSDVSDVPTVSYSPPSRPKCPPPSTKNETPKMKKHSPSTSSKTPVRNNNINNKRSAMTGMVRGLGDAAAYEIELRAEEEKRRAAMSKADREILENREFMEAVWSDI